MLECLKQNVHVRLKQLRPSFTFKENGRFTAFDNKDVIVLQSFIYIFVSGKKKKIMQDSFFKPGLKFFYKVLLMAEMSSVPRSLAIQPKVPCCKCYQTRPCCPTSIEANTMAPAFEQKKAFIARSTGKETGDKAQICLPGPGFGARFKEFQHQSSWITDRTLLLKGFSVQVLFMSQSLGTVAWWREQLKVHKYHL